MNKTIVSASALVLAGLGLVGLRYFTCQRSKKQFKFDKTIGYSQVWQHPSAVKGTWNQAFIVVYTDAQQGEPAGYAVAYFSNSADYVLDAGVRVSHKDINGRINTLKNNGYVRYTSLEVAQFGKCYGAYQSWEDRHMAEPKALAQ